jgi:hypothetical protein
MIRFAKSSDATKAKTQADSESIKGCSMCDYEIVPGEVEYMPCNHALKQQPSGRLLKRAGR